MGLTCDLYQFKSGIGDALWFSTVIANRPSNRPRLAFVDPYTTGGLDTFRAIRLWTAAYSWPWDMPLPDAAREPALGDNPTTHLRFDLDWLKIRSALPSQPYTVVQPATGWFKSQTIKARPTVHPAVLIGSAEDRSTPWPGPATDLRGKLTVAESLWVVANAADCFGCESWPALLAGLCGRPALMLVRTEEARARLAAVYRQTIPSLAVEVSE